MPNERVPQVDDDVAALLLAEAEQIELVAAEALREARRVAGDNVAGCILRRKLQVVADRVNRLAALLTAAETRDLS
jgi:hypothetical protein